MGDIKEKILIVSPGESFFTAPHIQAFSEAGYECSVFNFRSGAIYSNRYMRKALRILPWGNKIKRNAVIKINQDLLSTVKELRPKYLFAIKGENVEPETIQEIKRMGVITINFYNDLMNQWSRIAKIAPAYDYFFNQCHVVLRRLWNELGLENCFYLAHATEPLPERKLLKDKKYTVSFVGTHNNKLYPNREKYLKAIADMDLHIWGTDGWRKTPLEDLFHGPAEGDQRFHIYANSKIVVDMNWDFLPAEGLSNRPFEAAGCGAMFMTDDIREDIRRVFKEGEEVVLFKDEKDLRDKLLYYLGHDTERERIARAGYLRTVKDHTYRNRVEQIFDTIRNPQKYLHK